MSNAPIGMFDSGLGGLSVMHAVRDALPGEDIIYYGDCLYAPYGDRKSEYIKERCLAIGRFLISKGAKAIVVSCNTATAEGVNTMRETFNIPIIGIEPAIKPAAAATQTGVVGVIATTRTITSERYLRLVREFAGTKVKFVWFPVPGPGRFGSLPGSHGMRRKRRLGLLQDPKTNRKVSAPNQACRCR